MKIILLALLFFLFKTIFNTFFKPIQKNNELNKIDKIRNADIQDADFEEMD